MALFIIIATVVVIVIWLILTYNTLIKLRNRSKEAWADIDVQLKRRHNLVPNLVRTVRAYASHESQVFEKISEARARAMGAKQPADKAEAENMLSSTLKTLFAVSEDYPDLRASENFFGLQKELRDTEDKIQAARRFYNSNVRDINIKIESFPSNIIANIFAFKKMDLFELEEPEAREVPKVKF